MARQEAQSEETKTLFFIKEVARYFMEFLETDFHKRKNPRRTVKFKDDENRHIGFNIARYPSFNKDVWKLINHEFDRATLSNVEKGVYKTNIPESLLDLVKLQAGKIKAHDIHTLVEEIVSETTRGASLYKKDYDKALGYILEKTSSIISSHLVLPFVENLEQPLANIQFGDDNVMYLMQEELTSIFTRRAEPKIADSLKYYINDLATDLPERLKEEFDLESVRGNISDFFENYKVGDLFVELFALDNNKKTLDKQEFYLYFCDIAYDKVKYPLFYIPFELERADNVFQIAFDSQVYINKKALNYIAQEYNVETDKQGGLASVSDRIIYLAQQQGTFYTYIHTILNELVNFFELDQELDLTNPIHQVAKSQNIKVSNSCYIQLFDKSDEALINDYEEILNLEPDSELLTAFQNLINDFIHNDPKTYMDEVNNEWDELDTPTKLAVKNPVPLNSEQIKILSAVQKSDCKYIVVEGPPGTGKSHTITAVLFNAILRGQSVLVLSDKKEALDVVNDKIVATIENVRSDNKFQNPILRLGKIGNNFDKILSVPTMQEITQNYRAVKRNYDDLESNIDKSVNSLKDDLNAEIAAYDDIDIRDIYEFLQLESSLESNGFVVDREEALRNENAALELDEIRRIFFVLKEKFRSFGYDVDIYNIASISESTPDNLGKLIELLRSIHEVKTYDAQLFSQQFPQLVKIKSELGVEVDLEHLGQLYTVHNEISKRLFNSELLNSLGIDTLDIADFKKISSGLDLYYTLASILQRLRAVFSQQIDDYIEFDGLSIDNYVELDNLISTYESLRSPLFGFLFKGRVLQEINFNFKKTFPYVDLESPHKHLNTLKRVSQIAHYALELANELEPEWLQQVDYLKVMRQSLMQRENPILNFEQLRDDRNAYFAALDIAQNESWFNVLGVRTVQDINSIFYVEKFLSLAQEFESLFDRESEHILQQAELDSGLLDFLFRVDTIALVKFMEDYKTFTEAIVSTKEDLEYLREQLGKYPQTISVIGLDVHSLHGLCNNSLLEMPDTDFEKLIRYISLGRSIGDKFNSIPSTQFQTNTRNIERLVTAQMTYILDGRVVSFYENSLATAKALREIIKSKQKFPKEQFTKLKEAFPCILAGIRDYAEYIPLEPDIFDLVIIDEASQVSIAQAFPALLRAKKVLILGDKKQFGNVKSAQAKSDTNREYLANLEHVFTKTVSNEPVKLVKLRKFNIKTSILEFFEFITNFNIQLQKHFRGYKEIISYSNRYFYQDSLQVMKIRGVSIDEALKFSVVKSNAESEGKDNTNKSEAKYILEQLESIKATGKSVTVGIITPHTEQQRYIYGLLSSSPDSDYYFSDLKLKVMTFDTCQGEERDIVFYSMVATRNHDKLAYVFPRSLTIDSLGDDADDSIRRQRLNVGFSRAKECMHFVTSKPVTEFSNSIGSALNHYAGALLEARSERTPEEVDQNSPMEKEILNWFYQTQFYRDNKDNIELLPQFEIGKYLKQLDKSYVHPNYKVDFLLVVSEPDREQKVIIEYDGFKEHFKTANVVNASNYEQYYSEEDVYRQKVLEGYGYKFLRINKFNVGDNPIQALGARMEALMKKDIGTNEVIANIHQTMSGLQAGQIKECPRCKEVRDIKDFKDSSLLTGYGRFCNICKANGKGIARTKKKVPSGDVSTNQLCPRCGASMIKRRGRHGVFYGCTKYPYCKGTRVNN